MLKVIFYFIAALPLPIAQFLGACLGSLLNRFDNRERRVARINIALCFSELSADKQADLVRQALQENAKTLLEMPRIFCRGGQYAIGLVKSVNGLQHYYDAIAAGRGVILLAPHLGNWELVVHYLNQYAPITAMFAPPKQIFLQDIMRKGRQSSGATLVPANSRGVRAQLKHLKKGGVIGILPDQKPAPGTASVFAPFMGQSAATMLLTHNLSQRTQAVVLMTFAQRLANGTFTLHIFPAPPKTSDSDAITAATALNQGIEQCIQLAPAQYQWTYKRFALQPDGEQSPYDEAAVLPSTNK